MSTVNRRDNEHVVELDHDAFELSEDEAELEDRANAVARGEWIDGDEVLRQLRSRRSSKYSR